jgi:hypothetical protein
MLHDPFTYATFVLVMILVSIVYLLPLFCWLARFLGWPWRRPARWR